jgi:hypothetical protein
VGVVADHEVRAGVDRRVGQRLLAANGVGSYSVPQCGKTITTSAPALRGRGDVRLAVPRGHLGAAARVAVAP